jgi:hypothetical protein
MGTRSANQVEHQKLIAAAVRLNTRLLTIVFACTFGLCLFSLTLLSRSLGLPDSDQFLNLLGVFLPGYEVSWAGAWLGLLWGGLIGALIAVLFYRLYARDLEKQARQLRGEPGQATDPVRTALRLDGRSLGLALGLIGAFGVILTTNWLVIRGTADESIHAMLLVNYLPGYRVSFTGSLIGALEFFVLIFVGGLLFSGIYNRLAARRGSGSR